MSKRTRRKHPSSLKASVLKKHHVKKVPVSDVCDQAAVQPSLFYTWQRQLFENAETVLEGGREKASAQERAQAARIAELEAQLAKKEAVIAKKDAVIAEISEERRARASFSRSPPHEHWHIDISYLNIAGTFYYLCSLLDGASRAIVHWEIREQMTELDVECVMQRARERFPDARTTAWYSGRLRRDLHHGALADLIFFAAPRSSIRRASAESTEHAKEAPDLCSKPRSPTPCARSVTPPATSTTACCS